MERGSDKHGPRLDEAMDKETRGLVTAGHDTHSEEWASAEPPGEDQPEVSLAAGTALTGGVPDGMTPEDVEGRAELASLLGKEIWPADGATVKASLVEHEAPDRVIDLVGTLGDADVFDNVAAVWEQLTGAKEAHRF